MLSTTGSLGSLGTDALAGAQIFVDEINARGGINGRPIQLINIDDESKPDQTTTAAKRLIEQEHVSAIVGPVSSIVSASVSPLLNEDKVPAVGCICYEGKITPYDFSIFPLHGMMDNQAEFAKKHSVTKIGVLSTAGPLAELVKADHVPTLQKDGMTIVGFEQLQPSDTDLTPLIARLRSDGAQQIYVAATGTPAATAARNFKQLNYKGYYWTFAGNANQSFINLVGDAADIVNLAGNPILVYKELPQDDPANQRVTTFAKTFLAKTGREPGSWAAVGYDAMTSVTQAITTAGDNPRKIRDALEGQKNLQLLNGVVNRSATEHNGLVPKWLSVRIDPASKSFTLKGT